MTKQRKGYWREMYAAAKQGNVDFLRLQMLSLEKQRGNAVCVGQLERLIMLAIIKKREQEEKLAVVYYRKRQRELDLQAYQHRSQAMSKEGLLLYGGRCVLWQ